MVPTTSSAFFDRVVEASGLVEMIAPYTVRRLLVRAGVHGDDLTPETLADALPHFEEGLAVYLTGPDLDAALERLRALAA